MADRTLGLILIVIFLLYPASLLAGEETTGITIDKLVKCENERGQKCADYAHIRICGMGKRQYVMRVTASSGHCSQVKYDVSINGRNRVETPFLPPGGAYTIGDMGYPDSGVYEIVIGATGRIGNPPDCNNGHLARWRVRVDLTPCRKETLNLPCR